jgi:excisionase family DNA binding protein
VTDGALSIAVPAGVLEEIAARAAELVLERLDAPAPVSPFMSIAEAAEFLRCKRQRIDDLLSSGRLTRHKDGSRTLVSRAELEQHVGAACRAVAGNGKGRLPARVRGVTQ